MISMQVNTFTVAQDFITTKTNFLLKIEIRQKKKTIKR